MTALHAAAKGGHLEIVRFLCDAGADERLRDADGQTPVHVALRNGYQEVAHVLLSRHLSRCPALPCTCFAAAPSARQVFLARPPTLWVIASISRTHVGIALF